MFLAFKMKNESRNGFKKNEFIIEYFGEVYPPWRWFEKQDLIRKKVKETVNIFDLIESVK